MKLEELRVAIEDRITALGYDVADSTVPTLSNTKDTIRVYVDISSGDRQIVQQFGSSVADVEATANIHVMVIGTGVSKFDDVPLTADSILKDLGLRGNYAKLGFHKLEATSWEMGVGEGSPMQRFLVTKYVGSYMTDSISF